MPQNQAFAGLRAPAAALLAVLALLAAAVLAITGISAQASAEPAPLSAVEHDPVILIPGMTAQASAMEPMKRNFVSAGWRSDRVHTWTDSSNMTGDLTKAGVEIGQKVDSVLAQSGARKVVLVTWSASTLAARSYLKHVSGAQEKVSMYFSMAGPHHGTTTAAPWCQNLYPSCRQFAIGSPWLAALNSGTEVPGSPAVRYTTLRSTCDVNVNPSTSAELAGAANRQTPTCIGHLAFPSDAGVFNQIKTLITEHEATPTTTPTGSSTPTTTTGTPPVSPCTSVNGQWAAAGPFAVTSASNGRGTTVFRPVNLGTLGCFKHPVLLWNNGAVSKLDRYAPLLNHLASHGFIVAAAEGNAGTGGPMLQGLDHLTTENGRAGSALQGKVDLDRVGATGHSFGGGAAVDAGTDPRVDTIAPIYPLAFSNAGRVRGPAVFFAGQNDPTVQPATVRRTYNQATQAPAIYAEQRGADHYGIADLHGPITAWFRFHLMGDEQARGLYFGPNCAYCSSSFWSVFERNPKAQAVPGS
ncbi:dienelactone hydrolase family protein [Crossiella sp. CA-258035]|uniref:poly(ethylene terephthalate) hydrolase family protein n=1 Tax=Crossiella sp. CA-258035 TaxID=2981138 RepID=UPI0024BCE652|nr:dienelactone hydrolase family protein [Crossiella sp. CA-258035]WHT21866.1 dienelactone hydrolase family protein [Crossiella sp. CA-258035]